MIWCKSIILHIADFKILQSKGKLIRRKKIFGNFNAKGMYKHIMSYRTMT